MTAVAEDTARSCTALSLRYSALRCMTLHDTARHCAALRGTALRMFGTALHDTARHDTGNNRGCQVTFAKRADGRNC